MHYAATHYNFLPHIGNCTGTETAALFGCGLITVYLGLFINFYVETYKKPVKTKKVVANGNGFANGNGLVPLLPDQPDPYISSLTALNTSEMIELMGNFVQCDF